jgi:hypothetical protein
MLGVVTPATSCDLRFGESDSDPVNYRLLVFRRELRVPSGLTHRLVLGGVLDFPSSSFRPSRAMSRTYGVVRAT